MIYSYHLSLLGSCSTTLEKLSQFMISSSMVCFYQWSIAINIVLTQLFLSLWLQNWNGCCCCCHKLFIRYLIPLWTRNM
jgi:hypothetical protein